MGDGPKILRCAIYTRKSSEEGLDQDFNSLDAQREACAAYIVSQLHEGWVAVPGIYDDGGFSGGNMERPGLKALLGQVAAGKVDMIVVYKVDRLTRSLSDFARIVDVLDKQGASFVSVTQSFNTTTSMGRLTLNVLLSFAQFEREVTGERIRDKIAASKARGMWMGGPVPLGYDLGDRKLVINELEAATVRHIYSRYLELGSGNQLVIELERGGIRSKPRVDRHGRQYGDQPLSRGAVYAIFQSRLYVGEVTHKQHVYPGQHLPIVEHAVFEAVQVMLAKARVERRIRVNAKEASLLAGVLYDGLGRRMSPSHANKAGKRYRYYVSQVLPPAPSTKTSRDPALIKLIVQAVSLRDAIADQSATSFDGLARALGYSREHAADLLRLSYLAPDIISSIIDGRQPAELTRTRLMKMPRVPLGWQQQRSVLGF
ncbi:MAG: recombinase family protein [Novosphingobium sp.]|nr:recombinase family protein [Novosphingobium sp.]